MKKIKKTVYVLMFTSLILLGCGRKNKEATARLDKLDENIATLYNEEKTDLHKDISEEKIAEILSQLDKEMEQKEKLNDENQEKLDTSEESFTQVEKMYDFDREVKKLFEADDILKEEATLEQIEAAERRLADFDIAKLPAFFDRHEKLFLAARSQLKVRSQADRLVERLFENEETVREDATRAQEKEAHEAVEEIKNEALQEKYKNRLEKVNTSITKREKEEEERKRKEEEEHKRKEEEKRARSIGDFEGMYLSADNFIYYLNEKTYMIVQNAASDNMVIYEIQEIRDNTGQEVTLKLFEEGMELHGTEDSVHEETLKLSEDKNTLTDAYGYDAVRLSNDEIEEVYSRLSGLKAYIESYN